MTEMMQPIHEKVLKDVIDPEVPEKAKERLKLLSLCMAAKAYGYTVEGVTPHHVGMEGMYLLQRQGRADAPQGPRY